MNLAYWRYLLKREWPLVIVASFLGLIVWFYALMTDPTHRDVPDGAKKVPATITSLTFVSGKRSTSVIVAAKSADGLSASTAVRVERTSGCKPGDPIEAGQKGVILYISPHPCTR